MIKIIRQNVQKMLIFCCFWLIHSFSVLNIGSVDGQKLQHILYGYVSPALMSGLMIDTLNFRYQC